MREYMASRRLDEPNYGQRRHEGTNKRPTEGLTTSAVSPFLERGPNKVVRLRRFRQRGMMPYVIPGRVQEYTSREKGLVARIGDLERELEAVRAILRASYERIREALPEYKVMSS